jgi:hypothetical protein
MAEEFNINEKKLIHPIARMVARTLQLELEPDPLYQVEFKEPDGSPMVKYNGKHSKGTIAYKLRSFDNRRYWVVARSYIWQETAEKAEGKVSINAELVADAKAKGAIILMVFQTEREDNEEEKGSKIILAFTPQRIQEATARDGFTNTFNTQKMLNFSVLAASNYESAYRDFYKKELDERARHYIDNLDAALEQMEGYRRIITDKDGNLKWVFPGSFAVDYKNCVGGKTIRQNYRPLIRPQLIGKHYIWANFIIPKLKVGDKYSNSVRVLEQRKGFNLDGIDLGHRHDQVLNNCVDPHVGLAILKAAIKDEQRRLI